MTVFEQKHFKVHDLQLPASTDTFRLFDLPAEIRQIIYRQHFETWDMAIQHDSSTNAFKLTGIPLQHLTGVSRQAYAECKPILDQSYSGTLIVRDAKIRPRSRFGFHSSLEIIATLGIDRVLSRVRTVIVEGGTTGMLALLPWHKLPSLQTVELENCYTCNPFSTGLITQIWPFEATEEDDGTCQICGVYGWSKWTQVPECVADGRVRVVSVRKAFFAGSCLKAVVEHKADHGLFVERVYETVKEIDRNKQFGPCELAKSYNLRLQKDTS